MSGQKVKRRVMAALAFFLVLNWGLWLASRDISARWLGVPPVPDLRGAVAMSLGDRQLAYRSGALTLQTLGDTGGRVVPLKDYDYGRLGEWFMLLHALDPASDHVPMVAGYYFGATRVPADLAVVVDYLARIGDNPAGQKWRWLGHAAYLARHGMKDTDQALSLAYRLARLEPADRPLPLWARQMPAFILSATGEKEASRRLVEHMLTTAGDLHPNEVNFLRAYLVETLSVPEDEVDRVMNMRRGISRERD